MNVDLTKITTPFGILLEQQPEVAAALKAHGGPYEFYHRYGWATVHDPSFQPAWTYRVRPEPLRPLTVRWEHMPYWAKWAARDKNGGIFVYNETPELLEEVWVSSWGGSGRIDHFQGLSDPGTVDWRDSLIQRPEGL